MGFWAGALTVLLLAGALAVLLYAWAIWDAQRDEPYLNTVWNLAKQILSGEFW